MALVLAALVLVYLATGDDDGPPAGALTDTEQAAVANAGTIARTISSLNYKTFDASYAAAIARTTGGLKSDLQKNEATTKKQVVAGKLVVNTQIRHAALEGPATKAKGASAAYVVLVNFYSTTSAAPANPNPQNLEITIQQIKGQWYGSDASSVGTQ